MRTEPTGSFKMSDRELQLDPSHHIVLVEDDARLATSIIDYLQKHDFWVSHEAGGEQAVERISELHADLVVLDVTLPGKNGFDICRDLRAIGYRVPVIMLSARDDDFDQVLGLELGADDYLTKPVHPRVLVARINAILRRMTALDKALAGENTLTFGKLRIAGDLREVQQDGKAIGLTSGEFDLLWLLAKNAGKTLTRAEILKSLRSLDYDRIDRSVDNRIYRLRKKLGNTASQVQRIKSVRALGYVFSPIGQ
jgi:two-component system OmpR family response regulator